MSTEGLQSRGLPASAWRVEWLGPSESCVSAQNKLPFTKAQTTPRRACGAAEPSCLPGNMGSQVPRQEVC